mmetsp:Transcript_41419/g.93346  ORF Transcript_41419/g.93346 Transcript_41419/m.93346 type:complete len:108 (-) Transcript_41419:1234-1557(-)
MKGLYNTEPTTFTAPPRSCIKHSVATSLHLSYSGAWGLKPWRGWAPTTSRMLAADWVRFTTGLRRAWREGGGGESPRSGKGAQSGEQRNEALRLAPLWPPPPPPTPS